MKSFSLTILLFLLLALPGRANELDSLLERLRQAAAATQTLSSDFIQEKHLAIFSEKLLSEGRFAYRKPDQLRWELLTPFKSGFVLRGDQGVRWNGLSRERGRFSVERDPVMGMIAKQLLAWARVDLEWLQQRYQMELLQTQPPRLRLIPRDRGEAGFIRHLDITFAEDLRHIATVLLQETAGDQTLLHFKKVELNRALPDKVFEAPEF